MDESLSLAGGAELLDLYRRKALSPLEVAKAQLDRIARLQPVLNAFQLVDPETTLAMARAAEDRWRRGAPCGPLDGLPVTIKDMVLTKGWPTLRGSRTVAPDQSWDEDSPCVARLREAGAVFLGKTTTPEFGWKAITTGPLFGMTRSPWDPARTPGGSSGGAGAALAAGIGTLAHGGDAGGSIRIPASYCGLFGLKPSFGRVPHAPQDTPFATIVSQGPLARSVADAALALNVLARPDPRDPFALPYDGHDWTVGLDGGVAGLRIGLALDTPEAEVDPEVAEIVETAAGRFADLGAKLVAREDAIPALKADFEAYWLASFAHILRALPEGVQALMDPDLRAVAERGLAIDLPGYAKGVAKRAWLTTRMNLLFTEIDLLVTPTTPTTAPAADTRYNAPGFERWHHFVPFTLPFNLTGLPAASLCCGLTAQGLPVGLQIVAPRFAEARLLRAARALEAALDLPRVPPALAHSLTRLEAASVS